MIFCGFAFFFVKVVMEELAMFLLLRFERVENLYNLFSLYLNPWEIPLCFLPGDICVDECIDILNGSSSEISR